MDGFHGLSGLQDEFRDDGVFPRGPGFGAEAAGSGLLYVRGNGLKLLEAEALKDIISTAEPDLVHIDLFDSPAFDFIAFGVNLAINRCELTAGLTPDPIEDPVGNWVGALSKHIGGAANSGGGGEERIAVGSIHPLTEVPPLRPLRPRPVRVNRSGWCPQGGRKFRADNFSWRSS